MPQSQLHPKDASTARVADQIVSLLRERGIERVFGIPGGAISGVFDALIDSAIDVVITQHEGMAAYLAAGHARATGKPGVVIVTSGPGLLNAVTGMAMAQLDEVPLLVLAGDVKAATAGRGALQDGGPTNLDVLQVTRPLAKRVEAVGHPERAVAAVHAAFDAAMTVPRGAAFVSLAMDATLVSTPRAHFTPAVPTLPVAPDDVRERILSALTTAERPALWLGVGARAAAVGSDVLRLVEKVRCPVVCDIEAKALFPERHPLSLGLVGGGSSGAAERYLEGADLLVTVGARLDDTNTCGFRPALRAREMIQLDSSVERLNRAYAADVAVQCDLAGTLRQLAEDAGACSLERDERRRGAVAEAFAAVVDEDVPPLTDAPHHPVAVLRALQRVLPPDVVFTADIGNHLLFAARHLVLEAPNRFHAAEALAAMGSGIGLAMGLAFGDRSRPVVGICGDGGFRMVATELATCALAKLPVVLAVFDDAQLGMVQHGNESVYGRAAFCASPPVDIAACARALGARGVQVERASDLEEALAEPLTGPLVLSFPIRPEVRAPNPRQDVFAFQNATRALVEGGR